MARVRSSAVGSPASPPHYELTTKHPGTEIVLLRAGPRLGGKIGTQPFAGLPVELGPDTFLARVPWAVDLCKELGLFDELVRLVETTACLVGAGALRPARGPRARRPHRLRPARRLRPGLGLDEAVAIARGTSTTPGTPPVTCPTATCRSASSSTHLGDGVKPSSTRSSAASTPGDSGAA